MEIKPKDHQTMFNEWYDGTIEDEVLTARKVSKQDVEQASGSQREISEVRQAAVDYTDKITAAETRVMTAAEIKKSDTADVNTADVNTNPVSAEEAMSMRADQLTEHPISQLASTLNDLNAEKVEAVGVLSLIDALITS